MKSARLRMVDPAGADQVAAIANRDWRDFERPLPEILTALSSVSEGAFYDVGANTGFYSVLIGSRKVGGVVRAFEAVPAIAEQCAANLRANELFDVDVQVAAVGASVGTATIYLPPGDHGLVETSASLLPDFKEQVASAFSVPLTTLDEVNARHDGEAVALIKIDVEGAEDQVLAGAPALIERSRPYLTVELLPRCNWDAFNGFLAANDYVAIPLRSDYVFNEMHEVSFHANAHNHLLFPAEKSGTVGRVLDNVRSGAIDLDLALQTNAERAARIDAEVNRISLLAWVERGNHLRQVASNCERTHSDLAHDLEASRSERDRLVQELDIVSRQLQALKESTSWRLTRPLRSVGGRIRPRQPRP